MSHLTGIVLKEVTLGQRVDMDTHAHELGGVLCPRDKDNSSSWPRGAS